MTVKASQNSLYGFPQPLTTPFPPPIVAARTPTTSDVGYPLGQVWVYKTGPAVYMLVAVASGSATWDLLANASTGPIETLTGDSGGPITPTAGNINLLGTANQITTTGSGSSITWSLPTAITAPGSLSTTTTLTGGTGITATTGNIVATAGAVNAGTSMTATLGNITATNGNVVLGTAGNKLNSTSVASTTTAGANSFGTVALASGTATVATTAVTANSMIHLTIQALGTVTTAKAVAATAKTANTSFVITSADATDTSTVAWFIIN